MAPANPGNFPDNHHLSKGLTKQQKIGLVVLAIFTLAVLILWYSQLKKSIIYPFYGGVSPQEFYSKLAERQSEQAAALANQDTDKDGLTDADEMNIYQTSPYLADTDGDGLSDKEEIAAKSDPNCPEGKDCGGALAGESSTSSAALSNPLNQLPSELTPGATPVEPLGATAAAKLKEAFGANPDPSVLRDSLLQAATKEEDAITIKNLSDEQLLQLYQQMIGAK